MDKTPSTHPCSLDFIDPGVSSRLMAALLKCVALLYVRSNGSKRLNIRMSCCFTESQETPLIWCCLSVRACWSTEMMSLDWFERWSQNMYSAIELIFITGFQKVVTAVISWKWILWRSEVCDFGRLSFVRIFQGLFSYSFHFTVISC